jgi:hypothetical protein
MDSKLKAVTQENNATTNNCMLVKLKKSMVKFDRNFSSKIKWAAKVIAQRIVKKSPIFMVSCSAKKLETTITPTKQTKAISKGFHVNFFVNNITMIGVKIPYKPVNTPFLAGVVYFAP